MPQDYLIGVDESGTGAFAGPFTVCAFMAHRDHTPWLVEAGARDSKLLSRRKRLSVRDELAVVAKIAGIVEVPGDYTDLRAVWRAAIIEAVEHCLSVVAPGRSVMVMVDGNADRELFEYFNCKWRIWPAFVPQGDMKIPEISAASIFAKCRRSELMAELHDQYPMYGWDRNDGYGTRGHIRAIQAHGVCALHRRVRPLLPYFVDATTKNSSET